MAHHVLKEGRDKGSIIGKGNVCSRKERKRKPEKDVVGWSEMKKLADVSEEDGKDEEWELRTRVTDL